MAKWQDISNYSSKSFEDMVEEIVELIEEKECLLELIDDLKQEIEE